MYIAYGWPKVLRLLGFQEQESIVHVEESGGLLAIVSTNTVQIWTAGQHRVRLGESNRSSNSLREDGENKNALWNAAVETLAVLTTGNLVHFYDIIQTKDHVKLPLQNENAARFVKVKFRSSTRVPLFGDDVSINGIAGDDDNIILGLSNGRLHLVSWRGQLRGTTDLWKRQSRVIIGPMFLPEANNLPGNPQSPRTAALPYAGPLSSSASSAGSSSYASHPAVAAQSRSSEAGVAQLAFCEALRVVVVVLLDGRVVLCSIGEKGLRPVEEMTPEKWVGVMDAVCVAVAGKQQVLAVGSKRGTVELFDLARGAMHLRTISLFDWGYTVDDTGMVQCISWSPDNRAFAVGWRQRGLAVWSVSGCRLMCTIRHGSLSFLPAPSPSGNGGSSSSAPSAASGRRSSEPMACGVAALAWGQQGYHLLAVERPTLSTSTTTSSSSSGSGAVASKGSIGKGNGCRVVQFSFAMGCKDRAISGSMHLWQVLQAEDRVLLVQSNEQEELRLRHLVIPQAYIGVNWPVLHVASNDDGSHLAVAGQRGVILHNLRAKKWRMFGDVAQERAIKCVGLLWLGKIIVICNHKEATDSYELLLYPRFHLDESSLLARHPLASRPMAIDTWRDYILVATQPFDIRVLHVHLQGELSTLKSPPVQVRTVRELSIMSARKPLVAMRFVPRSRELDPMAGDVSVSGSSISNGNGNGNSVINSSSFGSMQRRHSSNSLMSPQGDGSGAPGVTSNSLSLSLASTPRTSSYSSSSRQTLGGSIDAVGAEAMARQPTQCMLLRTDGELSLLDLDVGSERPLVMGVEHFWLARGGDREEAELIEEVPWWAYGHRGMQVWYPSSHHDTSSSSADLQQLDPELDFDREVYPLGVSPAAGVIVGMSQRLALSSSADMPCFEPTPQAQPILPCLLRHLLQRHKMEEAVQLARLSANRPHFSHSLEWLLFTIFDAETSSNASKRRRDASGLSMLDRACQLIRQFAEYLDVVVSVARKTDSRHWGELFASAGKSSSLFEECFEKKQYRTATCYILVVEKLESATTGQQYALRLLQATLEVGMYELAGELVRFLLRSGREFSHSGPSAEDERHGESLIKSFFSFGFTSAAPKARGDVLHATVSHILGAHAVLLLSQKELRDLVAFVKGTQFDLPDFLRNQKDKSIRLEDFPTALRTINHKLGIDKGMGRQDADFLLIQMRLAAYHEWTVVLATLLRRAEVLAELFREDLKLWAAYSRALKVQPNAWEYDELLSTVDKDLNLSKDKVETK